MTQPKLAQPRRRFPFLVAATALALVMLACAFFGSNSRSSPDRIAIRKHLATLTPTPLPTLLPTLIPSADQTVPLTIEPITAAPTPPPVPSVSTATIPHANDGPMLTALAVLNIRSGPGLDYPIVGQLAQGQSAQITGKNPEGTWWQVVYPPSSGSLAWVSADVQYSTVGNAGGVLVVQLPPAPTAQVLPTLISPTPAPPPTVISSPEGWAFANVRFYPNQEDGGLLLYGNAINNTGTAQELISVTGIFYDDQGQVLADGSKTYAYWPGYVVPAGGSMPFELVIDDIGSAARYDLRVEAKSNSESPRQDFEFAEVSQWTEDDTYCVGGVVRNSGSPLAEYLVVAAVLYDSQNNLVNFSDEGEIGLEAGSNDSPFEICVGLSDQQVARHELQAWGR